MTKLAKPVQGERCGQSTTMHAHISVESPTRIDLGTKGNTLQPRVGTRPQDLETARRTATVKLRYELLMHKATYKTSPAQTHFT